MSAANSGQLSGATGGANAHRCGHRDRWCPRRSQWSSRHRAAARPPQAVQLACSRRCWPERQHDTGRPRPRRPAANAGTAGRRLASVRPISPSKCPSGPPASGRRGRRGGPLRTKGKRHDRTSRTLSASGPCHFQAAPVPRRHRAAHAIGGHERAQTAALRRKIAPDDAQNHPPPVTSARLSAYRRA
jgi:hypothetical protein